MKKWLGTLGIVLTIALTMTGCGGGGDKDTKDSAAASSSTAVSEGTGTTKDITIEAKNFEFDQPEIKVNKGDTVSITLKNSQGNHGIELAGYNKEIKGDQTVTFVADQAGEFEFHCSIMCGGGHAKMTGKLIVQ
ncbi:cupredoxin domain-containing protein [Paenibacillus sp. PR3]|uniref:Cupredoxin domain-containing protein n=1 Tax=Paenibacillus terricola TaxID=2763503 RepID=A0ABR8MUJ4_9BACL|nr:cupredoxin domain-containing protein [Paenibacillus terricola]MBD3919633.1 cupredoxin domain-containing protein [Paenibacillus terricola]